MCIYNHVTLVNETLSATTVKPNNGIYKVMNTTLMNAVINNKYNISIFNWARPEKNKLADLYFL